MPLLRVPCIILALMGLEITVTPPQPPPLKDEEAPSTNLEIVIKQRCGPALVKVRPRPEDKPVLPTRPSGPSR